MKRHVWLAAMLCMAATGVQGQTARARLELRCEAVGAGPALECLVRVSTPKGQPVTGAQVALSATMPSMPMAHRVTPAVAVATGQPGEYRGALELEMAGVWAVQVDIDKPLRDRVVVRLQAEECPQGQARCVVQPAGGKP